MNFTDNLMTFSIELAQQLVNSTSDLPVDFNLAWEWVGYSKKGNAKQSLLNTGFIENVDFLIEKKPTTTAFSGIRGGDVNENIYLTIECFKMWAMMAKTEQGKQVRLYFLECEKVAKQKALTTPQTYIEALKALVAVEEAKEQLALENSILQSQVQDLEADNERQAELVDELYNYSSIVRIAKLNNISEKSFNWRRLKSTCEVLKLEILQAPDQKFGVRNLYPREAWRIAYPEAKLPEILSLVEIK